MDAKIGAETMKIDVKFKRVDAKMYAEADEMDAEMVKMDADMEKALPPFTKPVYRLTKGPSHIIRPEYSGGPHVHLQTLRFVSPTILGLG